jgi:hypothetical protein
LLLLLAVPAGAAEPLRLRATPALAPCARALADAFVAAGNQGPALEIAEVREAAGADLLLADDSELTRILEGGSGDERATVDLGEVPWVMVSPLSEPAPGSVRAFGAARDGVAVLGGIAGRSARAALGAVAPRVSQDVATLRLARRALLPRSLAGTGRITPMPEITPLTAMAVPVVGSPHPAQLDALLRFLRGEAARRSFESCGGTARASSVGAASGTAAVYAQAIADWWLPGCSLQHNGYNDPQQALGAPNALNIGGKDQYSGLVSLGQGGWIVVDMGQTITDVPGPDVRVYQSTSNEPVSLYAGDAATGPFRLVGLRHTCGTRSPGLFSSHCDFDLAEGGIASARYLRIEDGELYPCLAGGTLTEGADIDAVELLGQ